MMEKTLTLPRLGETMEEGTVLAWSKISGEEYDRGDILLELETDKMVVEVPALEDGKILEILADEGAVVAIGEPIARVEVESSESVAEVDSVPQTSPHSTPTPQEQPSTTTPSPSQEVDAFVIRGRLVGIPFCSCIQFKNNVWPSSFDNSDSTNVV